MFLEIVLSHNRLLLLLHRLPRFGRPEDLSVVVLPHERHEARVGTKGRDFVDVVVVGADVAVVDHALGDGDAPAERLCLASPDLALAVDGHVGQVPKEILVPGFSAKCHRNFPSSPPTLIYVVPWSEFPIVPSYPQYPQVVLERV